MREPHPDYGDYYPYSDHQIGDTVQYRMDGSNEQGTIVWVSPGFTLASGEMALPHYLIVNVLGGIPDVVYFADILMDDGAGGPILVKCPYCLGYHEKGLQNGCPLYHPS